MNSGHFYCISGSCVTTWEWKYGTIHQKKFCDDKVHKETDFDLCDEAKVHPEGKKRVCYCNGHLCNTNKAGNNANISSILLHVIFGVLFLVSK
jgi:hypothetical protein